MNHEQQQDFTGAFWTYVRHDEEGTDVRDTRSGMLEQLLTLSPDAILSFMKVEDMAAVLSCRAVSVQADGRLLIIPQNDTVQAWMDDIHTHDQGFSANVGDLITWARTQPEFRNYLPKPMASTAGAEDHPDGPESDDGSDSSEATDTQEDNDTADEDLSGMEEAS